MGQIFAAFSEYMKFKERKKKGSYMRCYWPTSCSTCCSGCDIRPEPNLIVDVWHRSTLVWPWGRFWLRPSRIGAFPLVEPSILTLGRFLEFVLIKKKIDIKNINYKSVNCNDAYRIGNKKCRFLWNFYWMQSVIWKKIAILKVQKFE